MTKGTQKAMHSQLKTTESALIQLHLPCTQLKKKCNSAPYSLLDIVKT